MLLFKSIDFVFFENYGILKGDAIRRTIDILRGRFIKETLGVFYY